MEFIASIVVVARSGGLAAHESRCQLFCYSLAMRSTYRSAVAVSVQDGCPRTRTLGLGAQKSAAADDYRRSIAFIWTKIDKKAQRRTGTTQNRDSSDYTRAFDLENTHYSFVYRNRPSPARRTSCDDRIGHAFSYSASICG